MDVYKLAEAVGAQRSCGKMMIGAGGSRVVIATLTEGEYVLTPEGEKLAVQVSNQLQAAAVKKAAKSRAKKTEA